MKSSVAIGPASTLSTTCSSHVVESVFAILD